MNSKNDFKDFVSSSSAKLSSAPKGILEKTLEQIETELPSKQLVLLKLMAVHLIASVVSLILCPQFGVRILFAEEATSLMDVFMHLGHEACFFLCGVFYLSGSFLAAKLVLDVDHWVVIHRSRLLLTSMLALLSLGALSMIGRQISLELSVIWFFGAYLGGSLFTREWWKLSLYAKGNPS